MIIWAQRKAVHNRIAFLVLWFAMKFTVPYFFIISISWKINLFFIDTYSFLIYGIIGIFVFLFAAYNLEKKYAMKKMRLLLICASILTVTGSFFSCENEKDASLYLRAD